MSINVHLATVATGIAALSMSGVTIKDLDNVPENGILMPGTMYPNAENFVDNILPTVESQGVAGAERVTLEYDMHYRYLHCSPGNLFSIYAGLITAVVTIMVSFLTNDTVTGAVDLRLKSMSKIGTVYDPAGNPFWGCDFTLRIKEFCEVA